ncbi:MAG: hypothetical protein QOJ27_2055 [Sphingomonadales bacterium]|nr:hypothetical protein [Sphingomonadales bacterium]
MEAEYRDPRGLGRTAVLWLRIWLAAQISFGLASVYEFATLSGLPGDTPMTISTSPPEAELSDLVTGGTGILNLLAFWVSGIIVLRWIHRVNANAQGFAGGMTVSPGWNVGWFFVPFANLIKPFQGVRETWQVSQGAPNWQDEPVPVRLRWWWACWLVTNFIDNASFRLSLRSETVGDSVAIAGLNMASAIVSVPLGLLLIRLIRDLAEAQDTLHSSLVFR